MICQRCHDAPGVVESVVTRLPDGSYLRELYCEKCHYACFGERASLWKMPAYLPLIATLAGLNTAIVCLATAPWIFDPSAAVQGNPFYFPRILLVPVLNGIPIGILLILQSLAIERIRRHGLLKRKGDRTPSKKARTSKALYDREVDG